MLQYPGFYGITLASIFGFLKTRIMARLTGSNIHCVEFSTVRKE